MSISLPQTSSTATRTLRPTANSTFCFYSCAFPFAASSLVTFLVTLYIFDAGDFYSNKTNCAPSNLAPGCQISRADDDVEFVSKLPSPPPPLPPHRLLLLAEQKWDNIIAYLRTSRHNNGGMIGINGFVDSLISNGVIVSKPDGVGLFCAVMNLSTTDIESQLVSIDRLSVALDHRRHEPLPPKPTAPVFMTGHVAGDVFSAVTQEREKKHFNVGIGGNSVVIADALYGNPSAAKKLYAPSANAAAYDCKEAAPYHLEGQKNVHSPDVARVGRGTHVDFPPSPPPYALVTELSSEVLRTRKIAEEVPPVLKRALAAANNLRASKASYNCTASIEDPVYMLLPDVGYKRTLPLTRNEAHCTFQKLGVNVKGGDIEKLWWYMENRGEELTREALYKLLGGESAKVTAEKAMDKDKDAAGGLSLELRRVLHQVSMKANAVIRGCMTSDVDGNGKVPLTIFLDALSHAIELDNEGKFHVTEAVTAGQESKDVVKYSSLVSKISDYIHEHSGNAGDNAVPQMRSPARRTMISAGEPYSGDVYTRGTVCDGGKRHFSDRGGSGGRDHIGGRDDSIPKVWMNEESKEVQDERKKFGVQAHVLGWGKKHFEGATPSEPKVEGGVESGVDQFKYLRIDAPKENAVKQRVSDTTGVAKLKQELKWDDYAAAPASREEKQLGGDGLVRIIRGVSSMLFMARPELASAFRQFDVDNRGSLDCNQLVSLLQSSKLKTGLESSPTDARLVALSYFEQLGKNPNTTSRIDFNELAVVIGKVLEDEEREKARNFKETFQAGTREWGERRNEVRQPQTFGEVINKHLNPPKSPLKLQATGFRRSQIVEESIAAAVWNSRSLSVVGAHTFQASAIMIRHAFMRHIGKDRAGHEVHGDELSCREADTNTILFSLGIYLNDKQLKYLIERCADDVDEERMGAVEKRVVGKYVKCKNLVLFLAGLCGMPIN